MMLANDATNAPVQTAAPERLTWDEICERYPDEWVVLVDFDRPGEDELDLEFTSAVVIAHHTSRKAASPDVKKAFERYIEVGSFFTGRLIPPAYEILIP